MDRMTIEEFKEKSSIEIIESIMKMNNGYITSKELDNYGIHRMYLNTMWKKGIVEKVANGIYIDSNKMEDAYCVFSLSMPNTILDIDVENATYEALKEQGFEGIKNDTSTLEDSKKEAEKDGATCIVK